MEMKPKLVPGELHGAIWEPGSDESSRRGTPDRPPLLRFCCGEPILPKWARVKERSGEEFCALVWACQRCALISYYRVARAPLATPIESLFPQQAVDGDDSATGTADAARHRI